MTATSEIVIQNPCTNAARQAYEETRETYGIDDRNDFKTFLEQAATAGSILEISRSMREERTSIRGAMSRLGLYCGNSMSFPPADRDERIEMLRRGEIPEPVPGPPRGER